MRKKELELEDEMKNKQLELGNKIRREQLEWEEVLRVANERTQKIEQFMYSHTKQTSSGGYGGFVRDGIFGGVGGQR